MPKTVESVFIFQERSHGEPSALAPTYDAIVVEQWTVIDVSGDVSLFRGDNEESCVFCCFNGSGPPATGVLPPHSCSRAGLLMSWG